MTNYFKNFPKTSEEEWKEQLLNDLKGKPHTLVEISDEIEEIQLDGYTHVDAFPERHEIPGAGSFVRGMNGQDNGWNNGLLIEVTDEKTANSIALRQLMAGVDLLLFRSKKEQINWSVVLADIQLEYIKVGFEPNSLEDQRRITKLTESYRQHVSFHIDFIDDWSIEDLTTIASEQKETQQPFCLINGFGIQHIGGTTWQEIAFCLNSGHECLLRLMESGLTIDQAAACITFRVGIGADYFFSIAKIRSLKQLWASVISAYNPQHSCTSSCTITAMIGHLNKSLKDPHTNLLRQTTESMAALSAGVDSIIVLPHDFYSTEEDNGLSERMAVNIPLILKEESYFDKVIDPLGGSYTIERMTELISDKAWKTFQSIEKNGGLFSETAKQHFVEQLLEKRNQRIAKFEDGNHTLIGITTFLNPEASSATWKTIPSYLGIDALIFEQLSTKEV